MFDGVGYTLDRPEFESKLLDISLKSGVHYIPEFELDHEDLRYYDPENALIHLNNDLAPGGYGWVFPKSGKRINIGLGVQKRSLDLKNKKTGRNDNLQSLIDKYVK